MTALNRFAKPIAAASAAATWFFARTVLAIETGLDKTAEVSGLGVSGEALWLPDLIGRMLAPVLGLIGVLFVILMIYAGFLWMTAGGNQEQIKKAKGLMVNAVIGTIIVFASYAIANFIIGAIMAGTMIE